MSAHFTEREPRAWCAPEELGAAWPVPAEAGARAGPQTWGREARASFLEEAAPRPTGQGGRDLAPEETPSAASLLTRHIPAVPAPPTRPSPGEPGSSEKGCFVQPAGVLPTVAVSARPPSRACRPARPPQASGTGPEPQAGGQRAWCPVLLQPWMHHFPLASVSPLSTMGSDRPHPHAPGGL